MHSKDVYSKTGRIVRLCKDLWPRFADCLNIAQFIEYGNIGMCVVRQGPLITSRTRLCPGLFHPNFPVFFPNQAYKGLDLPTDVKFVWNYLKNSYSQKAFTESCPADQVRITYWKRQSVCVWVCVCVWVGGWMWVMSLGFGHWC